jgi:hypothetical protein
MTQEELQAMDKKFTILGGVVSCVSLLLTLSIYWDISSQASLNGGAAHPLRESLLSIGVFVTSINAALFFLCLYGSYMDKNRITTHRETK